MGPMRSFCGGGMMILPLIMMFVLGVLLIYLLKKHGSINNALNAILSKKNSIVAKNSQIETISNPMQILKERYAKGEITKEEFDQMKKDLE